MAGESKLKTVDIKGKPYVEVNERIKYFRANYKGWSLTTELVSLESGTCVMKATIKDENDVVKATGYAYEKESSSFINKTSYIENCETSAWGRALGNLGIGIDASIASADEVQNAQLNQETTAPNQSMAVKEAPATLAQKVALRNALDHRYGNQQGRQIFDELGGENISKRKASEEIDKLYKMKN